MLSLISKFRNVCAHNERLYNYTTKKAIKDLPIHIEKNINNKSKNDLFAIAICFKYLLEYNEFSTFLNELKIILDEYQKNCSNLLKILKCMGFPQDWYCLLKKRN